MHEHEMTSFYESLEYSHGWHEVKKSLSSETPTVYDTPPVYS